MDSDLDDEQLLYLVGTNDKELFDSGLDIKRRAWEVPSAVMKRLGHISFVRAGVGKPEIFNRIEVAFASIYRNQDLAIGGHIGVFMYRDIFCRIGVPHIYGQVSINPFEFVDLTLVQLRIIQSEPDQLAAYLDQFFDLVDIEYGLRELKNEFSKIELVDRYLGLSRLHLHSASAVLTGGYDYRGAVQAALLATELALKAGAAARGLSEDEIKNRFGHNSLRIVDFVGAAFQNFDLERVKRAIANQPSYVRNRYDANQPERRAVGDLVMKAQYIASEIFRQLSNRNSRSTLETPSRHYPA